MNSPSSTAAKHTEEMDGSPEKIAPPALHNRFRTRSSCSSYAPGTSQVTLYRIILGTRLLARPTFGAHMLFTTTLWRYLATPARYPCVVLEKGRRWDDYGYVTRFDAYFLADAEAEPSSLGFVKILQRGTMETQLENEFTNLDDRFCSLGQDLEFYGRIHKLGPELSREILLGLRDIVYSPEIFAAWSNEPGLQRALLRSSEALKAFREAGALFGRHSSPAQGLTFSFTQKLFGFDEPHQVGFDFRAQAGGLGRAMVLVGKNGTGKTALLARLAHILSGLDVEQTNALTPERPNLSVIIAISYSAFDTFTRPQMRYEPGVSYFYCGLRAPREPTSPESDPSPDTGRVDPEWAIRDLKASLHRITVLDRKQRWADLLEQSGLFEDIGQPAHLHGTEVSQEGWFHELSSGHKIIVMILTNVLSRIQRNSMLLFDEPELHLHPQLLSNMMRSLHLLLEEYESYAILATHSPLVLQETPARAIRIVERRGRFPFVAHYPGESFGENLTELVHTAFRVDEENKNYIQILKRLTQRMSREEIVELFDENLSLNARMTLRALTDPADTQKTSSPISDDKA
jgi:ABC-type lipoprotein export system ATPase subunit